MLTLLMFRKNAWNALLRSMLIMAIQAFLLSNAPFAISEEKTAHSPSKEPVADSNRIAIPEEYGQVSARFNADSKKLVVIVQDAHCNYEAQSNISKILDSLVKDYGLSLIAVEGAQGAIDTSRFDALRDSAARRTAADYSMKKGEISGPEFFSITSEYAPGLFGVEKRSFYLENLEAFRSSYPFKKSIEERLNNINTGLELLKRTIYSDELKLMDARIHGSASGSSALKDHVIFLKSEADRKGIDLRKYSHLFRLANILIMEKGIDFDLCNKERRELIDELSKRLTGKAAIDAVKRLIAFRLGKISPAGYYNFLNHLAAICGIDMAKDHPELFKYIEYLSAHSEVENGKLLNNLRQAEEEIASGYFKNSDQRMLWKLSRHMDILIGMVNIRITSDEYAYYMSHRDEFADHVFIDFLQRLAPKYYLEHKYEEATDAFARNISKLEEFYAIAIKRNGALVENTLSWMKKEGQQAAVLVIGGFHSQGVEKLLEEQNVSYLTISPLITKDLPTPYFQILADQRAPLAAIKTGAGEALSHSMLAPPAMTEGATK